MAVEADDAVVPVVVVVGEEGGAGAYVADFFSEEGGARLHPPGVAVRIGDGLGDLVREHIVSGVSELAAACAGGGNGAAQYVLVGLDAEEDVADCAAERNGAVEGAEVPGVWIVGRVALDGRAAEAHVHAWRQEYVVDVAVAVAGDGCSRVDEVEDVVDAERVIGGDGVTAGEELGAHPVAVVVRRADVLVNEVNHAALAVIGEEGGHVAPGAGRGVHVDGMVPGGEYGGTAAGIAEVAGVEAGVGNAGNGARIRRTGRGAHAVSGGF